MSLVSPIIVNVLLLTDPANVEKLSPMNLERKAAEYALFTCDVSGLPVPTVQWSRNNEMIVQTKGKFTIETTAESTDNEGPVLVRSKLLILNLTDTDQHLYTCTGYHSFFIENYIGAVRNASASLLVRGKYCMYYWLI